MSVLNLTDNYTRIDHPDGGWTLNYTHASSLVYSYEFDPSGKLIKMNIESQILNFTESEDGWEVNAEVGTVSGNVSRSEDSSSAEVTFGDFNASFNTQEDTTNVAVGTDQINSSITVNDQGVTDFSADLGLVNYQYSDDPNNPHTAGIALGGTGSLEYDFRNSQLSGTSETFIPGVSIDFSTNQTHDRVAVVFETEGTIPDHATEIIQQFLNETDFPVDDYDISISGRIELSTSNSTVEEFIGRSAGVRYDLNVTFTDSENSFEGLISIDTTNFLDEGVIDPNTGEKRLAIRTVSLLTVSEDIEQSLGNLGVDIDSTFQLTGEDSGTNTREFLFEASAVDFRTNIPIPVDVSDDGTISLGDVAYGTFGTGPDPLDVVESRRFATLDDYITALSQSPRTAERYQGVQWTQTFHEGPFNQGLDENGNATRYAIARNENGEVVAVLTEGVGLSNGVGNYGITRTEYFNAPVFGNPLPFSTVQFTRTDEFGPVIIVDGWIIPTTPGEEPSRNISQFRSEADGSVTISGGQSADNDAWLSYEIKSTLAENQELFLEDLRLNLRDQTQQSLLESLDEEIKRNVARALIVPPFASNQDRIDLVVGEDEFLENFIPTNASSYTTEIVTEETPRFDENGQVVLDEDGRVVIDTTLKSVDIIELDESGNRNGDFIKYDRQTGKSSIQSGAVRIEKDADGVVEAILVIGENEQGEPIIEFDLSAIGSAFGSTIGSLLVGENANLFERTVSSTLFSVIGANLADTLSIALAANEDTFGKVVDEVFDNFGVELEDAVVGAVSSLLVAELVEELGLDELGGQFVSTLGSAAVSETLDIIISSRDFGDFKLDFENFQEIATNFVANYIGKEIGSQVYAVETKEGAIGASLGASVGATIKIGAEIGTVVGFVGIVVGAAIGYVVGGLLGDIIGGTPRAGADMIFDHETGEFIVTNVWKKDGGSKSAVRGLATNAADILNSILESSGSEIINDNVVYGGTYSLRKSDFSYRPIGQPSQQRKLSSAEESLAYGIFKTIEDLELAGGNVFVKRAVYKGVELLLEAAYTTEFNEGSGNFIRVFQGLPEDALETLLGNISIGQDYARYREFDQEINILIMENPESVFAAGWLTTLEKAQELDLDNRHESDHFGGWSYLLKDQATEVNTLAGIQSVEAMLSKIELEFFDNERFIRINRADRTTVTIEDLVPSSLKDNIDFTDQTTLDELLATVETAAVIQGTDGDDTINAGDLGNDVFGEEGNDQITGGQQADWLFGGRGDDDLDAVAGNNNALFGEEGNDTLSGGNGSDWLSGGAGVDEIRGGDGDDVIEGGTDNDRLEGEGGNDTYIFRRGDGQDTLSDQDIRFNSPTLEIDFTGSFFNSGQFITSGSGEIGGGIDTIEFGEGINLDQINIRLEESTGTLVITLLDSSGQPTSDTLSIIDWDNSFRRVEKLRFADGQEIDLGNFSSFIVGSAGNDVLTGSNGADFIHGGLGDDVIRALAGDDVAIGGLGNDQVSGDEDNDLVVGGDGADNLFGNTGNDVISGDRGNDAIAGGAGNDTISGGEGDDQISLGSGNDQVLFGYGDGKDELIDSIGESLFEVASYNLNGPGLVFIEGYGVNEAPGVIGIWDQANSRLADGFILESGDSLNEWRIFALVSDSEDEIRDLGEDTLEFKLGVSLQDIRIKTDDNDLLIGLEGTEELGKQFEELNNSIRIRDWFGSAGPAIETFRVFGLPDIDATSFTKWIGEDNPDDIFLGTSGRDWITSGPNQDRISSGAGDDIISGGAGNDTIEAGAGADIIFGKQGFDTLSYASASSGVVVNLTEKSGSVGDAAGDQIDGIEYLEGSDYDDQLIGDANDNEFTANKGADFVVGGQGDDVYIFERGDGSLIISEASATHDITGGGQDILQFNGDISPADLNFSRDGFDLRINISGTIGDTIVLKNWFLDPSDRIETIVFVNGDSIDISNQLFNDTATSGPDWLTGSPNGSDVLDGEGGNDIISGRQGDDIINGGDGHDLLFGGSGADSFDGGTGEDTVAYYESNTGVTVYLDNSLAPTGGIAVGDTFVNIENLHGSGGDDQLYGDQKNNRIAGGQGHDWVDGGSGADSLEGNEGNDTLVGDQGEDELSGNGGQDILYGGIGNDILRGGDENDLLYGDQRNDRLFGGEGQDQLYGGADQDFLQGDLDDDWLNGGSGADELRGGHGDDSLFGGSDDDVLFGEQGDDFLSGEAGEDYLGGGLGNDTLQGGSEDDILQADSGNDRLLGDSGNDVLIGDEGDDSLSGGQGTDFLIGGAGNDLLEGGKDTDFYIFDNEFGQDTIIEDADRVSLDEIVFSGITTEQLWFEEQGNDLIITVIGTENQVRIKDYARFRVNTDLEGDVLNALREAIATLSPIKSLSTETETLSITALDGLIENMSALERPSTVEDIPTDLNYDQFWQTATLTALDAREEFAPELGDQLLELDEGGSVTGQLLATDENPDDLLRYELVNEPTVGDFTLNSETGEFSFASTNDFSGEVSAVVQVIDSTGLVDNAILRFQVNPIDDLPEIKPLINLITSEDTEITGDLGFSDSDDLLEEYQLSTTAALGTVSLTSTGLLKYKPSTDKEGTDRFTLTLTKDGQGVSSEVTVTIIGTNDRPTSPSTLSFQVDGTGVVANQIPLFDPDVNDSHTYELISEVEGDLTLNSDGSFVYTVSDNYDGDESFRVRIQDASGDTSSFTETEVQILADAPEFTVTGDFTVAEEDGSQALGFVVATTGGGEPINYSLENHYDGRFTISETGQLLTTGSLDFEDPTLNDPSSYDLVVIARIGEQGAVARQNITVTVTPINEQPNVIDFTPDNGTVIEENIAVGTLVAKLLASDPDGDTLTIELIDDNNGNFDFVRNSDGSIRVNSDGTVDIVTKARLDFDTLSPQETVFDLQVSISDGQLSRLGTFTIDLRNVNDESPVIIDPNNTNGITFTVTENALGSANPNTSTLVGSIKVTDSDGNEDFDYALIGGDDDKYTVVDRGDSVDIVVANGAVLNNENDGSDQITLAIADSAGNTITQDINITIEDVNELPENISWEGNNNVFVDERAENGTAVGIIVFDDPDINNAQFRDYNFDLESDSAGNRFRIEKSPDGQGIVRVNGDIDFDTVEGSDAIGSYYDITVRLSDANTENPDPNHVKEQTLKIYVNNTNDAPIKIGDEPGVEVNEYSSWRPADQGPREPGTPNSLGAYNGKDVVNVANLFSDPDDNIVDYEIVGGRKFYERSGLQLNLPYSGEEFIINANGEITVANANQVTYFERFLFSGTEWVGEPTTYELQVRAIDAEGLVSENASVILNIQDIDEFQQVAEINVGFNISGAFLQNEWTLEDFDLTFSKGTLRTWSVTVDQISTEQQVYRRSSGFGIFPPTVTAASGYSGIVAENSFSAQVDVYRNWDMFVNPIVLDLGGDGLSWSTSVTFDIDNDGQVELTPWIGVGEGLLVLDRNNNGTIDNGSEISFVADSPTASTDLEGLTAFDSDGNGLFDSNDQRFSEFQIWQDINQNGISEASELTFLATAGIESINLTPIPNTTPTDMTGVQLLNTSTFTRSDGTTDLLGDVAFAFNELPSPVTEGTTADDTILGQLGDDHIDGLAGDDWLFGGQGNDRLLGNTGADIVSGAEGQDELLGGDGNDDLRGGDDPDSLWGDAGADLLDGGADGDRLFGGSGNDLARGGSGNDVIYGEEGQDTLLGEDGHDWLDGGANQDRLDGGAGNDQLLGGDGEDQLWGREGNDWLDGGAGNDIIIAGLGDDTISVGNDDNIIWYRRGDGQDTIIESGGRFVLYLQDITAAEVTFKQEQAGWLGIDFGHGDQIKIEADLEGLFNGTDEGVLALQSISFADDQGWDREQLLQEIQAQLQTTLVGSFDSDNINGSPSIELIDAYQGDDIVNAGGGDDQVYGHDGNDLILGESGADILDGGSGNDTLDGGLSADQLFGGFGSDLLSGGDGDDLVYGGHQDDTLTGEAGNDQLFGQSGNDQLSGGEGDDLLDGGADDDELNGNAGADNLLGGEGDDVLSGGIGEDYIEGGHGHDHLEGGDDNDILNAGLGNDWLYGQGGIDILVGQAGNDRLFGGDSDDVLYGDDDDDTLYGEVGNDVLLGGHGTDVLSGGLGNDVIDGGDGLNTILFRRGDGVDSVLVGTGVYGLHLYEISPEAVSINLEVIDADWQLTVDLAQGESLIFEGLDPNSFTISQVLNSISYFDQLGNLSLTLGAAEIEGYINGTTKFGTVGDDSLSGDSNDEQFLARDGDDRVDARAGNDLIVGGLGNDTLKGGSGNDVYLFNLGDGHDVIDNYDRTVVNEQWGDILRFGQGISPEDVLAELVGGSNLKFTILPSEETVTVSLNYNRWDNGTHYRAMLGFVEFADGTVWDDEQIRSQVTLTTNGDDFVRGFYDRDDLIDGGSGNDTLLGDQGADQLFGGLGDDRLEGNKDDDLLSGGAGNDTLKGGSGNDVYLFNLGDGHDRISNYDGTVVNGQWGDRLRFGEDISSTDVTAERIDGSDLRLTIGTSGETVTVLNNFLAWDNGTHYRAMLGFVEFADGTVWDTEQISASVT